MRDSLWSNWLYWGWNLQLILSVCGKVDIWQNAGEKTIKSTPIAECCRLSPWKSVKMRQQIVEENWLILTMNAIRVRHGFDSALVHCSLSIKLYWIFVSIVSSSDSFFFVVTVLHLQRIQTTLYSNVLYEKKLDKMCLPFSQFLSILMIDIVNLRGIW